MWQNYRLQLHYAFIQNLNESKSFIFFFLSGLDPVSVVPASPLNVNKGDPIELQCRTKSSTEYTLSWMKASHKSLHPVFFMIFVVITMIMTVCPCLCQLSMCVCVCRMVSSCLKRVGWLCSQQNWTMLASMCVLHQSPQCRACRSKLVSK